MKHVKLYEEFQAEFISESETMTFDELKDKYAENPYGIGANAIEAKDDIMYLRFEESYKRDQVMKKIKEMGIPAKKMSKDTQDKAYKYRYELIIHK